LPGPCLGEVSHPDRCPISVPGFFIHFLSQPGDLVVDPFAGTGTTALAADDRGRRWLCVDHSAKMIGIAQRRLSALV
jgi:DNA modification methylase